jgi:hypothetical protein
MLRFFRIGIFLALCISTLGADWGVPRLKTARSAESDQTAYYWQSTAVGDTAEMLTLFCRACEKADSKPGDVPVVAVLRDTLGDANPETDRLSYVWLLSYRRPNLGQRLASAIPFFYWRIGGYPAVGNEKKIAPLLNVAAPEHPLVGDLSSDLLQWTMLDAMTTPIRASSRAYRTNLIDHERLHIEEAISYLQQAPTSPVSTSDHESSLTRAELNTLIARLELRKKLLGGFVNERSAVRLGEEAGFLQERIRSRNWELLRECAERTGLVFEPLAIGGTAEQYAMLWFPLAESHQPTGTSLASVWKLLNIRNPWSDRRLKAAEMADCSKSPQTSVYQRSVSTNGDLLPPGESGVRTIRLVPLGVYSLNYPKVPLLLIDFRDKLHVRRHELAQRSINEITNGVIGVSHFTNWYYYLGADLYNFVASRHGEALDQSARLDCYSQFRVKLALDRQLDPALRKELETRVDSLAVNPLESDPDREMESARARYAELKREAGPGGRLADQLDKARRSELARFGSTKADTLAHALLHFASVGLYTHRTEKDSSNLVRLAYYRRLQYQMNFLASLIDAGTAPEIAHDTRRVQESVNQLGELLAHVQSPHLRRQGIETLLNLQSLSQDESLRQDCSVAISVIDQNSISRPATAPGILASPKTPLPPLPLHPGTVP